MGKKKILTALTAAAAVLCLVLGILFAWGAKLFVHAEPAVNSDMTLRLEALGEDSEYLKNGYLERYGVPIEKFTYKNNGGAENGAPLSYAFDRNFGSVWRSLTQTKENDPETVNYVEVEFKTPTRIDRIVYQADSSWYDRGYFNTLTLSYTTTQGETKLQPLVSKQTDSIVLLTLGESVTAKKIKLEWTKVPTNHRTVAAASEIIFLQPHSADVEAIQNMFTDYAQLHLDETKIRSKADVAALREKVKDYASYDGELNYLLTRAEQVLDKTVYFEARREMSTDPKAANVITQHGDVAGYARGELKFAWFGTNRQATGVSVSPDDELVVYVTGEEGDPLPSIVTTQHWGSWKSWRSGEYKLRLGKNVIKPNSYLQEGYTTNTGDSLPAGGPVYIVNPYESGKQSSKVKVYLEGGDLFPIYREDGDENSYKKILADYADTVRRDREDNAESKAYKVVDVTEIVSDHIIITVTATRADALYNGESYSPLQATKNWDTYVEQLLKYDGVVFENTKEAEEAVGGRYDKRCEWLNCNIRLAQPYGAAYAHIEHVGIQVSWEATAITGGPGFGWGYTHELGHMLDIGERTVSECSNNMISKFHETVIERTATRGDFEKTTAALAPDAHMDSYWNTNRGNFIFWWLIESYYPGFWARLDNRYRYEDVYQDIYEGLSDEEKKSLGTMNATEKQVYLSSLVTGDDLSYYFERWGYNLGTKDFIFEADGENTSEAFKKAMQVAKEKHRISEENKPKLWYLDAAQWLIRYYGKSELYTGAETPTVDAVTKSANGYNLIISGEGFGREEHLGYEVLEGSGTDWKVIGFTYDRMFLDTNTYETGYAPTYKVVAYDRALQTSAESAPKQYARATADEGVCRIGTDYFASLYEAVAAAKGGQTIVLLKDTYETGILIDKEITITAEKAVTVTKGGPQSIFIVEKRDDEENNIHRDGKLTLTGSASALITLDGGGIETTESLISLTGGTLTLTHCVLRNNILKRSGSSYTGGALRINGGIVRVTDCKFEQNSARLGGSVSVVNTGEGDVLFDGCEFVGDVALEGGSVYNRGTLTFSKCTFRDDVAETYGGAIANMSGGVMTAESCTFTANKAQNGGAIFSDGNVTLYGGSFTGNEATEEGAAVLYRRSTNGGRFFYAYCEKETDKTPVFSGNICKEGAAVYLNGVISAFTADIRDNRTRYALCLGGVSAVLSGGVYGGDIFKEAELPLSVQGALPEADGEVCIYTDTEVTSLLLLTFDKEIPEEYSATLKADRGLVVRGEDPKTLWINMDSYVVQFRANGEDVERHYLQGQVITLPSESGDELTYVKNWTREDDSEVFAFGESVTVDRDMVFLGETAQKSKIEFRFTAETEVEDVALYLIPGESYFMPRYDLEKYVLSGWECGEAFYLPYDSAEAGESDLVYTSRLIPKLAVHYAVPTDSGDRVYATRYYAYGTKPASVACKDETLVPQDGYINGFRLRNADGSLSDYINFDTYTVINDNITLVADVVELSVYIMYSFSEGTNIFDDTVVTEQVPAGGKYTVTYRTVPTGYHAISAKISINHDVYQVSAEKGFEIELNGVYFVIIDVELEKNNYNVNYEYNGNYFKTVTMEYGSTLRFEDPSDTLLKEALGDKKYSFMSYQLTTVDPMADPESPERTQQIDMTLGSELTITEEVTVNILVYIEEEASAPEAEPDPDVTDELPRLRAEYKQQADALASALVRRVSANDFKLTAEQQAEYVTKIRLALQEAVSAIDGKTTAAEMDEIIAALQEDLEAIEEEASRIAGVEIRLLVSGITAKTKTYDGTDSAELDLSGVVFIDKETNLVISAQRAAEFVLTAEGRYDSPNAGSRTILVTLSLENADGFVLDATQIVIESEIFRARLTVSVDREGKPVFDGFVNGETEQVLSGEFHVGYEEKADGTRTAHPSGFSSENYDIVYLDVVFEAAPKASKLELILGITIPAAVLVAAAAVAAVILRKKKL